MMPRDKIEQLEPATRARTRARSTAATPKAEHVLLCSLHEGVTGNGTPRLRGRLGHAVLTGWLDRDPDYALPRWQIFAYAGRDAAAPGDDARVYIMSLVEKVSASGVRRLVGRLGPTKVTAYLDREAPRKWLVYVERFLPWPEYKATASPQTCENLSSGGNHDEDEHTAR